MANPGDPRITQLVQRLGAGDADAAADLFPLIYEELRGVAQRQFKRERADHTLQPTALVHEAYLRLLGPAAGTWEGRAHFLAIAGRVMRQILVDHVRHKGAKKRTGPRELITLERIPDAPGEQPLDLMALDDALARLSALDARKAQVVELRLFAGMTVADIASVLDVSKRTIEGDWHFARAWLQEEIAHTEPGTQPPDS